MIRKFPKTPTRQQSEAKGHAPRSTSRPSTTKTIIALHSKLWWRSFLENKVALVISIVMLLSAVGLTLGMATAAYDKLANHNDPTPLVLIMALGSFIYFFLSVAFSGTENPIEPEHFGALPLRFKDILPGMVITTFISSRGVTSVANTLIMAFAGTLGFSAAGHTAAAIVWPLACIAQLLVTVVIGEACYSMIARLMHFRGWREFITTLTSILFIAGLLVPSLLSEVLGRVPTDFYLGLSRWSPFGAAASTAAEVSASPHWGSFVRAIACLAIWALAVLLFIGFWTRATEASFRNPIHSGAGLRSGAKARKKAGIHPTTSMQSTAEANNSTGVHDGSTTKFHDGSGTKQSTNGLAHSPAGEGTGPRPPLTNRLVPRNQWGAVFSRALLYWRRDSRLVYSSLTLPLLSVVYIVLGVTGNDTLIWFSVWLAAFAAIQILSNVYGYDGPSNWLHIAAGVNGRTMVTARTAVGFVLTFALWLLNNIVIGIYTSFSATWFANSALSFGALIGALSLGAYLSVASPYPTSPPGINPMRDRSGGGSAAFVAIFGGTLTLGALSLPGGVMMSIGTSNLPTNSIAEIQPLGWAGLAVHFTIMGFVLWLGVRQASRRLDANWPKIFNVVRAWK